MERYEITGCATDVFTLEQIKAALRKAKAFRVNQRHAFGWSNQPLVATFAAIDPESARSIADAARKFLPEPDRLPCLTPYKYTGV